MTVAAVVATLVAGGVAFAQAPGLKAADRRHEQFGLLGKTFKTLKDELAKDAPDKTVLVSSATTADALARKLPGWFPKGSGKEAQPKSAALPSVWTDAAGFKAAARNFQIEAAKLKLVAGTGDVAALRVQFQATGQTCGACHKAYREPKS